MATTNEWIRFPFEHHFVCSTLVCNARLIGISRFGENVADVPIERNSFSHLTFDVANYGSIAKTRKIAFDSKMIIRNIGMCQWVSRAVATEPAWKTRFAACSSHSSFSMKWCRRLQSSWPIVVREPAHRGTYTNIVAIDTWGKCQRNGFCDGLQIALKRTERNTVRM